MDSRYRDEHAALRAKQTALEDEVARLTAENEALRAPPTPPPPPQQTPGRGLVLGLIVMVSLLGGAGMFVFKMRARRVDTVPARSVQASWEATVKTAAGAAGVREGAPCTIRARLDYRGATFHAVHETVVQCGGIEVYSERGVFAAGNSIEVTYDATTKDGRHDFQLDEKGVTTRAYPHAAIATADGVGIIEGEAPKMAIVLAITPGSTEAR